jgi:type VI secretion system protein ImpM
MTGCASAAGFYGKLPSHGDFVRRRVSDDFVRTWDEWLQQSLSASRWALGERWLDVYLTSPAWRFACAAGACGPAPVVGVMVPSVDRVGRYFPLTLALELPHHVSPLAAASHGERFFDRAERLAIDTLTSDQVDFDTFDERVMDLGAELAGIGGAPRLVLERAAEEILDGGGAGAWQIPVGSPSQLGTAFEQVLSHRMSALYEPLVLWWTEGSSMVEPSCLVGRGLPAPESFAALIDGSWAQRDWRPVAAHMDSASVIRTPVEERGGPRYRSAGATHVGCVRQLNQDALLERPEVGVWVVADGLGGHSRGELASRMVCDALADCLPQAGFEDAVETARARISEVNEHLVRSAASDPGAKRSGSTVVALLTRGSRCAILWAGDSRVYRWRSGTLELLTRDHSLAGRDEQSPDDGTHAVTRAVGAESGLTLDLHVDRVRAGDRFLLCSDGLTRVVSDEEVSGWMEHPDIRTVADGLIEASFDAGAPDNVTVLVVEAVRQSTHGDHEDHEDHEGHEE